MTADEGGLGMRGGGAICRGSVAWRLGSYRELAHAVQVPGSLRGGICTLDAAGCKPDCCLTTTVSVTVKDI